MGITTRFGKLRSVFRGAESELLNGIARLSIFYEDLQLEMGEFSDLHRRVVEEQEQDLDLDYRLLYFLRRALASLVEFRGTLNRKADRGIQECDPDLYGYSVHHGCRQIPSAQLENDQ